jgi:hypothetical protein
VTWRTRGTFLANQQHTGGTSRRWNVLFAGFAALAVLLMIAVAVVAPRLGADDGTDRSTEVDAGRIVLGEEQIEIATALDNPSLTPPDFRAAFPADLGADRRPLGAINELPGDEYLDFLFEFCRPECYRDAHFMNAQNPALGSGTWLADRPFYVRHGFVNNGAGPLSEDFDVVMYITLASEGESEFSLDGNVLVPGRTYRLHSDYVVRGTTDRCGPAYKTQTEPQTCEWFVHEFPNGLPMGRYDLWATWQAPCWAWIELDFTDRCDDPNEILSLFSSGVNAPFDESSPSFSEVSDS